jgi:hypothetical protein
VLLIDLLKNYDKILPPTIARKKRESERKLPIRKRTAMVDARMSRSKIPIDADMQALLAKEHAAKNPRTMKSPERNDAPPVPPIPANIESNPVPPPPPPSLPEAQAATPAQKPLTPPPPPPAIPAAAPRSRNPLPRTMTFLLARSSRSLPLSLALKKTQKKTLTMMTIRMMMTTMMNPSLLPLLKHQRLWCQNQSHLQWLRTGQPRPIMALAVAAL